MIYYYNVKVEYIKGKEKIIKVYQVNFLEIGELFCYLELKHKNNYKLISIRERKNCYYGKCGIK